MVGSPRAVPPRVAVVGGGIAGLTCADVLQRHGLDVRVLDKGRAAGGRVCTRRTEDGLSFDHGAQYFTIRDPWFRRAMQPLIDAGVVAPWTGRLAVVGPDGAGPTHEDTERWVGVPTMSALPRMLAAELSVDVNLRVTGLRRGGGRWSLEHDEGLYDGFDRVVLALPAAQAAALLGELPELQQVAAAVEMAPCWSLMVYLPGVHPAGYDGAFIQESPLGWAMRQPSKPGRPRHETWVLHANPTWTRDHWDDDHLVVTELLLQAWHERGGPKPAAITQSMTHRWRYALVDPHAEPKGAGDDEAGVALAGDWLGGGRVEGAFLSGRRAAAGVLRSLR